MSAGVDQDRATRAAMVSAAVMIAQQVAGKATRDAVFLSAFDISWLPPMILVAAAVSIAAAVYAARLMTRNGPARLVTWAFAASGLLFGVEAVLFRIVPEVIAVVLYLHMAIFGGILISGFWSIVNERFDPHTAKKKIGRIAGGATFGGLIGGVMAERVGAMVGTEWMFPILALLHLVCAWQTRRFADATPDTRVASDAEAVGRGGFQILASMPYLRNLALLLLLTTITAGLVDFVFKAAATAEFAADSESLLRFFAAFYTGAGLLTFVAQTLFTSATLERFGLVRTVSSLPASVVAMGVAALSIPGIIMITALRGVEDVVRNSLYRSGYELLYTPVPRRDKRATKLIIDVGFDRAGDAIGAAIVAGLLTAGAATASTLLVVLSVVFAVCAIAVSLRLHKGYISALEQSLLSQGAELDIDDIRDSTTRLTLLETMASGNLAEALKKVRESAAKATGPAADPSAAPEGRTKADPLIARIEALRGGDPASVELALRRGPLDPVLVPHAVALLAWEDVKDIASRALQHVAPRVTGQLIDALLDPDEAFAIRRRIPRVLKAGEPKRAVAGLYAALEDRRFEVRYQCALALLSIHHQHPDIVFEKRDVYGFVSRELDVPRTVWEGHRLLDASDDGGSPLVDALIAPVVQRGLEQVFMLLALVLPDRPVRIAFRGLHTNDPGLRGTALEYLDTALPETLRTRLATFIGSGPPPHAPKLAGKTAADRLEESMASIEINLEQLRAALDK